LRLESYQKELRLARDKADEINKMKSSFLANMSHEIRTPLNAICGFAEVLSSDDAHVLESTDKRYISQIIQNNANLLLTLINGILDMSRIESGKMKYHNEEFDWVEICKQTLLSVKTATHSEVDFKFETKHDTLKIVADKQLMTQILINLLNNASKFTKKGSITLNLSGNDKYITVSCTDTGIGIPLEKQKNIFDQFVKLDERSQGTGLGLALCKSIIEHYNGLIWVDNEYTDGARIVFSIPREKKDKEETR
jgi:signal transduction histidine kinase